jgi:hypothetical protein
MVGVFGRFQKPLFRYNIGGGSYYFAKQRSLVLSNRGEPTVSGKNIIERYSGELSAAGYFIYKKKIDLIYTYVGSEVLKIPLKRRSTSSELHGFIS